MSIVQHFRGRFMGRKLIFIAVAALVYLVYWYSVQFSVSVLGMDVVPGSQFERTIAITLSDHGVDHNPSSEYHWVNIKTKVTSRLPFTVPYVYISAVTQVPGVNLYFHRGEGTYRKYTLHPGKEYYIASLYLCEIPRGESPDTVVQGLKLSLRSWKYGWVNKKIG